MPDQLLLSRKNTATSHYYKASLEVGDGAPVYIPNGIGVVSISLLPAAASAGKVQFTVSPAAEVASDDAYWYDWPSGEVAVATVDSLIAPVTAVRAVVAAGTCDIEVVGA